MYHDQALIPIKTLDFAGGVNVTLGLPIVRTSPDHGTALDIAGHRPRRSDSLIAALRMADDMARRRGAERRVRHGGLDAAAAAARSHRRAWPDARKRLGQHFLLDLNLTRRSRGLQRRSRGHWSSRSVPAPAG